MMKLSETFDMMNSNNYKERFKAEYYQIRIRIISLKNMLDKWDNGELSFVPTCPRSIYTDQLSIMVRYMSILQCRALMEGIDLTDII